MHLFLVAVFVVAVVSGGIAAVAGFGVGSRLTPLLIPHVGVKLAVASVAFPHLAGTALRMWLLRGDIDWQVLRGFLGGRMLERIPEWLFRRIVGGLILALGVYLLVSPAFCSQ